MGCNKTSGKEACSGPTKHGEIVFNITKRDKIRNEIIRCKTGVKDIIERVWCGRGQWAGHVTRMSITRWGKIVTMLSRGLQRYVGSLSKVDERYVIRDK